MDLLAGELDYLLPYLKTDICLTKMEDMVDKMTRLGEFLDVRREVKTTNDTG